MSDFEILMKEFLGAKADMERIESQSGRTSEEYFKARQTLFDTLDKVNEFAKMPAVSHPGLSSDSLL